MNSAYFNTLMAYIDQATRLVGVAFAGGIQDDEYEATLRAVTRLQEEVVKGAVRSSRKLSTTN